MNDANETDRLRALVTLMREGGLTRLALSDGTVLERPPVSPLEAALGARKASGASSADDPEDGDEEKEEAHERDMRGEWDSYWGRMLASSGGGAPAFPGPEKAQRFLSGRH